MRDRGASRSASCRCSTRCASICPWQLWRWFRSPATSLAAEARSGPRTSRASCSAASSTGARAAPVRPPAGPCALTDRPCAALQVHIHPGARRLARDEVWREVGLRRRRVGHRGADRRHAHRREEVPALGVHPRAHLGRGWRGRNVPRDARRLGALGTAHGALEARHDVVLRRIRRHDRVDAAQRLAVRVPLRLAVCVLPLWRSGHPLVRALDLPGPL